MKKIRGTSVRDKKGMTTTLAAGIIIAIIVKRARMVATKAEGA